MGRTHGWMQGSLVSLRNLSDTEISWQKVAQMCGYLNESIQVKTGHCKQSTAEARLYFASCFSVKN